MNLCSIFGHKWQQVSDWWPVEVSGDFNDYVAPMALGRCQRCRKLEARRVMGTHTWGCGTSKYEMPLGWVMEQWVKCLPPEPDTIGCGMAGTLPPLDRDEPDHP